MVVYRLGAAVGEEDVVGAHLCVAAAANRAVLVPNLWRRRWVVRWLRLDQASEWVGVVIGPRRLVHWFLVSWPRFVVNWLRFVMDGELFPRWLRLRCVVDLRVWMRVGLGVNISSPVSGSCDNRVREQDGFERLHHSNIGAD